jgi:hypothetical protein
MFEILHEFCFSPQLIYVEEFLKGIKNLTDS